MADNLTLKNDDATVVGTLRTDDIGGVHYPVTKIALGADGVFDGFVGSAAPLPVVVSNSSFAVTQGGSWVVSGAVLSAQSGTWSVGITNTTLAVTQSGTWAVAQSGTWNVTVSNATLAATQSGSWTVAATQSGTWNVAVSNATLAATQSGTWNVGQSGTWNVNVSNATLAATQSGTWSVNISNATIAVTQSGNWAISSQPARVRTTDSIAAGLNTDAIMNGVTALTPKFAAISVSGAGTAAVVAAVTSKKIRVLAYSLIASAAMNVTWKSASTSISGAMPVAQNGGLAPGFCPVGIMETAAGEALQLTTDAAGTVGGQLTYVEV